MLNYCPECGAKLEEEYKFCPNCGAELKTASMPKSDRGNDSETLNKSEEFSSGEETIIICDNCGEENSSLNDICSGCGVRLKKSKESKIIKPPEPETSQIKINDYKKNPAQKKQSNKKAFKKQNITGKNKPEAKGKKSLDKTKIYAIVMTVLGLILAFYIIFGEFDSKSVSDVNTSGNEQKQSETVRLENIQKINQLQDQLKTNPNDTKIQLELANLQFDSGMFEQAIQNYQSYLKSDPQNADVRVDLGVCYYNLKNYPTAISEMETALKYNPKHQTAMMNLGIVNLAAGSIDKAKDWFQKAVKVNPNTDIGKKAQELLDSHQLK